MKVIFAPSIPWLPRQAASQDDDAPDANKLFRCLEEEGIESVIINPNSGMLNPLAGKNTLLQSIDPVRALRIAMLHRNADVVVSVFEGAAASLGAIRRLFGFRAAIVLWDIGLTNWRLRQKIINFTLPKIDTLFVLGKNQIKYIEQAYAPCKEIVHLGHYVDTDFYAETTLQMDGYVLSVGDDVGRDFSSFSTAVKHIDRQVILKAGNPKIENQAPNLKIMRDRLSFSGLKSLYAKSSVVVVPSFITNNASGVSTILEASASGRPMVVTDNPGIYDFIIPGVTCLVVPPQNPEALRAAIEKLLSDPILCSKLAGNARQFALDSHSVPVFAKKLAQQLRAVETSHKRRKRKLKDFAPPISS